MRGSKTSLGVVPLDVEDTLVEVAVREIAEKTGGHVEITRTTGGALVHDSGESKFLSGSVPSPDLLVADGAIVLGRVHSHNVVTVADTGTASTETASRVVGSSTLGIVTLLEGGSGRDEREGSESSENSLGEHLYCWCFCGAFTVVLIVSVGMSCTDFLFV